MKASSVDLKRQAEEQTLNDVYDACDRKDEMLRASICHLRRTVKLYKDMNYHGEIAMNAKDLLSKIEKETS